MVYENDNIEGLDASILTNSLILDIQGTQTLLQIRWLIVNHAD